jgi:hypothetical protein
MNYKITVGGYRLQTLESVSIKKSVETLADTAVITIPGAHVNRALEVEDKISEGDAVEIWLGYDDDLVLEFKGYLNRIATDDFSIQLECEDALFLFRKSLENRELKNITLKNFLNEVVGEVNKQNQSDGTPTHYTVECSYDFTWDKFVIYRATAFDVLKKVQDETRANIYFRDNILHIHPQYSEIFNDGVIIYDFAANIEKSQLKYVLQRDKKIEVEVSATLPDGTVRKTTYGTPGGEKREIALGTANAASMQARAEHEWNLFAYDGYEGNFTGWLIPVVEPAYRIRIQDGEYSFKNGNYYVVAVDTMFSASGGARTVTIGKKIN